METLIFTIGNATPTGYPLRLTLLAGEDQTRQELAEATMPLGLVVPDVPELGVTGPIADAMRKIMLNATAEEPNLEKVGRYLFQLLSTGDVGVEWASQRNSHKNMKLRCVLDIQDEELKLLPWELMALGLGRFFAETEHPFVRGSIDWTEKVVPEIWPLRVLIVVGCEDDDASVKAPQEVESIEDVLRGQGKTIYCKVLRRPDQETLRDFIRDYRPHIFHFIGHGQGAEGGQNAYLDFRSEPPWKCSAVGIAGIFNAAKWTPRLAFLNACHSSDLGGQAGTWHLVDGLQAAGVAAILGMQADVRGDAAAIIGRTLYASLARGESLDVALAAARENVNLNLGGEWTHRDWALPSLNLTVSPTHVLPVEMDADKLLLHQQIESMEMFARLRNFVARDDERWKLWRALNPLEGDSTPFLIVRGPALAGKSALVKWCLEGCLLRGRAAKYVDLNSGENNDLLDVLRAIRDGTRPLARFTGEALKPQAFAEFNRALNRYQGGGAFVSGPDDGTISDVDAGARLRDGSAADKELIVQTFCRALQSAVADAPLILVLDQVRVNSADWNSYFYPYLLRPIIERTVPNLSVIVILSEAQFTTEFKLGGEGLESIEVSLFEAARYEPLAWDFCRFYKTVKPHPKFAQKDYDQTVKDFIAGWRDLRIDGPWSPDELITLRQILKLV